MTSGEHEDQTQVGPVQGGPAPSGPGGQPPPYPPYAQYPPTYGPPRHPDALTALVLGGISLLAFPPLGPFAWYIGAKAGREMASAPGRWSGDDMARIGMVLGIVASAICLLIVLFARYEVRRFKRESAAKTEPILADLRARIAAEAAAREREAAEWAAWWEAHGGRPEPEDATPVAK